jgi:hypothetical protein
MKRSLTIDNHLGFHLTALRTVVAGGLLGLLHGLFSPATSYLADPAGLQGPWAWLYGACAVGLLGGAAVPPTSKRRVGMLIGCALLGGMSSGLGAHWAATAGCMAGGQIALSVAIGLYLMTGELPRLQAFLCGLLGGVMAFAAQRIPPALMGQDFMLELPNTAANLLGGLGMGLAIGSATIARHLRVKLEAVDKELQGLIPPAADDEISKLIGQAMTSYQQAAECLDEHPQARATAEQLVKKIARFGKKWQDIETQAHKSDRAKLDERIAELTARRDKSSDEGVRTEYERALAALREQVTSLDEIEKGRERAVARLHHQVATLDRLRLAALRHRSVGAAKFGEELKTVVDDLVQAGQELDTAAEVLAEVPN